jgi:hypothetical protein
MEEMMDKLNTEEEITELVADALNEIGFSASTEDTGGGICCVVLQRKDWGTADVNWGAQIVDADGKDPSIEAGATA